MLDLRKAEKRKQSGRWHVHAPGHPLARRSDGWAVLDRVALYEAVGPDPVCAAPGCPQAGGARLHWGSGRGMGYTVVGGERRPRVAVWHLDGDDLNVRADNLRAVCPSCLRRNMGFTQPPRGDRGRWKSPNQVAQP